MKIIPTILPLIMKIQLAQTLFFILSLPIWLGANLFDQKMPDWVVPQQFFLDVDSQSDENWECLLIDIQENVDEHVQFLHFVAKACTQSGVEQISNIQIDFDPSYQKVNVHQLRILRNGSWLDRKNCTHHRCVQREQELDRNLTNGEFTHVLFVGDIREGDILDYSYSISGERPFLGSHFYDQVYLQRYFPVGKIAFRVLANPNHTLFLKSSDAGILPKIRNLSPKVREWSLEVKNAEPIVFENAQPSWFNPSANVQISEYKNWQEVSSEGVELYALPSDFTSPEMRKLVKEWSSKTSDLKDQALFALRFVQDEIRYLGLEEGLGAYQPALPKDVLERRFGDCKDKSFLLLAFLKMLGIEATPIWVSSYQGRSLPELLPSPFVFNHVILQMQIKGDAYFVDPTVRLQGGALSENALSDYHFGLQVVAGGDLVPIPLYIPSFPMEVDTVFEVASEERVDVEIQTRLFGRDADQLRLIFGARSLSDLSDEYLSFTKAFYQGAELKKPIQLVDDREANQMWISEFYHIPILESESNKVISVAPLSTLTNFGEIPDLDRNTPFALASPNWIKEHVQVRNSHGVWQMESDKAAFDHPFLLHSYSQNIRENVADFHYETKFIDDHILQDNFEKYGEVVKAIEGHASLQLLLRFGKVAGLAPLSPMAAVSWIGAMLVYLMITFVSIKRRRKKAA